MKVFALILWSLALMSCSVEKKGFVFKYSNSQPEQAPRSQSMIFFEKELEARSGGRIQVENYFGAVLGNEREMMDMVAMGTLQGTRGGLFIDANPKYAIFMLPFLVEDWDQALKLINSDFTKKINEEARSNGFHIPATGISQGFRAHTNSAHPLKSPNDLKSLKMRVPPQEVYVLTARAFGTSPQEMPASEIYQALKTGVLDGQDNPPSNIWDYKIFEVQKYMTVANYSTGPDPFMVNLDWYESLPDDLKTIFDKVAIETIAYSDKLNRESESNYIQQLSEKLEVHFIEEKELEQFRALVEPVYQHFIDKGVFTWDDVKEAQTVARGK
ncbi:MAG: TRAP transporter substrate-binding protein [Verrucomicrobia bacterium]|nr:TRAP transporter substrate-binding protein [Verrucomicrobiota bacterium]